MILDDESKAEAEAKAKDILEQMKGAGMKLPVEASFIDGFVRGVDWLARKQLSEALKD